jgi:ribosomal protein S18 acetylase RimI-like enzyme
MEFSNDPNVFNSLWNALVKMAKEKGVSVLKGPVNGSIWHQYRCIKETNGAPFFKAEPFSETYYYNLFASNKPAAELEYYSASRAPFGIVLKLLEKSALIAMKGLGFTIREAKTVTPVELQRIADISRIVFSKSWGYTELDQREFLQLYSAGKVNAHLNALYLLYKGDDIIGFCSTMRENETTSICKTIAILPQYQGRGLGNALAYMVHVEAEKAGYKKMIYALIREGNNIKNFPKDDAVIFRRYSAFEFSI